MTLLEFITNTAMDLDTDVGGQVLDIDFPALCWDNGMELTQLCIEQFEPVLNCEVEYDDEDNFLSVATDSETEDWMLQSFLYKLAGYCSDTEWKSLFRNVEDD